MTSEDLRAYVRRYCDEHNLSLIKLARLAGCSRAHLTDWMAGREYKYPPVAILNFFRLKKTVTYD
ncbi:MAG TPA: helix-turn-helix transcriptional regulator [Burkholderiaceae bacterium]